MYEDDGRWWVPSFDPYDALIQLGKNQEDLFNRIIITNRYIADLQQQNSLTKAELNIAHRNNELLEQQIHNLHYEVAVLKIQNNQKPAII
jgi:hypothetical protein